MSFDISQYKEILFYKKGKACIKYLPLLFFTLIYSSLPAQQSNTLFNLHSIAQSNQLNPAVQPACKIYVGIPFLNTIHLGYSNSSFSYNDLANDVNFKFDEVYKSLKRMNTISVELETYILSAGYKLNNNYFSFSIVDRANSYNSYSRKLAGVMLYGNEPFIGSNLRINNSRANLMYYREYAAGWAFDWDRFSSFGIRAKLLFGKENLNTGSSRIQLGTDTETFDLSVKGNVRFNSSLPILLTQNNSGAITQIDIVDFRYLTLLLNPRNAGIAADFGVINTFSKDLTLSASLLDLGMIVWTDNAINVKAQVDFLYKGVQEGTDFSVASYFRDLSDSLVNDIIYDVTRKTYISPLPAQLFLAALYKWKEDIDLGLVVRNQLVNRRIRSSITASLNYSFMQSIQTSVSWSYLNNSVLNIGGGLAYTGQGFQLYAVSDNIAGLIRPLDTRSISLRFGMNLMLGCPRNFKKGKDAKYIMIPCPPKQRTPVLKSKRKNF